MLSYVHAVYTVLIKKIGLPTKNRGCSIIPLPSPSHTGALCRMPGSCLRVLGRREAHEEKQGALVHVGPGIRVVALQVLPIFWDVVGSK